MSYLLVLAGIEGAVGAAFVSGAVEAAGPLSQPVSTAPITIPNSTISVNILFIVRLDFTKSAKRTSTIFRLIFVLAMQFDGRMLRSKLATQALTQNL